jgi:hypothetical protein
VLFKKIALMNRKKFFCVNSFAAAGAPPLAQRNIYQAAEIAQLKPLYNTQAFRAYLEANRWIREYFPNYHPALLVGPPASERPSLLQRCAEFFFRFIPADRLDAALMRGMERFWERHYPQFDPATRRELFRCTRDESRAYAGNYQGDVLASYRRKLQEYRMEE